MAPAPPDLDAERSAALADLRLRWKFEEEMARLKSPSGQTGHYDGQYERIAALGPATVPILLDLFLDRARPLPGEAAAGPFRSIHPWMVRFEKSELRNLAGYGFAELVSRDDAATVRRLVEVFHDYWRRNPDRHPLERDELAPILAFALFDLGVKRPVQLHIGHLHQKAETWGYEAWRAWWDLGYAYIRIGEVEEGERWYDRVLNESGLSRAIAAYNLACNFAMRARREPRQRELFRKKALDKLEEAVYRHQYTDWPWMEEDRDLDFIRDDPRYHALLAHLEAKYPARTKGRMPKEFEEIWEER